MNENENLSRYIHPITGLKTDFDALLNYIADATIVLLGEATHGTHEFYHARAEITKRLIKEKGFNTIAIEGDWPETARINRYLLSQGDDKSARESLNSFERFPAWMWRNEDFVQFIEDVHNHNQSLQDQISKVNIYGLDLYSLHLSIEVVLNELEKINPQAAQTAKKRYQCFDTYTDPQEYGQIASLFPEKSCREAVIAQLLDLKKRKLDFFKNHHDPAQEKFYLEQNALVIKNAETYYTSLFEGNSAESWNIRDKHMMETINAIIHFNKETERSPKIIIWAHNSHVGNAQATQMASYGEINIGQLVKEKFEDEAISIGFTTFSGTVSAASAWGAIVERKYVRPGLPNSVEAFFHSFGIEAFFMLLDEHPEIYNFLNHDDYLERAIGVIYLPETERHSHYFRTQLTEQFDVVIHHDFTHAVVPLEKSTEWEQGEDLPETYPFGM